MKFLIFSTIIIGLILFGSISNVFGEPVLFDENLVLEKYSSEWGWGYTTMTFVGEEDILVLEKDGIVSLIREGNIQDDPVLTINVDPVQEAGLLGITNVGNTVYLYFTEADEDGNQIGNRIYKYDCNAYRRFVASTGRSTFKI